MLRVVVVGQTPPPYGGQAIMIQRLLEQTYDDVELFHVRMGFSREMDEVGRVQLRKLVHLLVTIVRIVRARIRTGADTLYYPPAGPERVPVYRDIALLLCVRWMFRKTILHFEAGGLTDIYDSLNPIEKVLFRAAYSKPDVVIRLSELLPEDGRKLGAVKELIVPNAIPDLDGRVAEKLPKSDPIILFVGVVRRSKGVIVLLEAAGLLKQRGVPFHIDIVGAPAPAGFDDDARQLAQKLGIDAQVSWQGVLIDAQKDAAYERADIFCFPSFFESETTPIVVMEAMRAGLPVVSTHWRGIADIVDDGTTGLLVPIEDSAATADALEHLLTDMQVRVSMGRRGRLRFEERFTLDRYRNGIQAAFDVCADL